MVLWKGRVEMIEVLANEEVTAAREESKKKVKELQMMQRVEEAKVVLWKGRRRR